jgi:hypothetical protein
MGEERGFKREPSGDKRKGHRESPAIFLWKDSSRGSFEETGHPKKVK